MGIPIPDPEYGDDCLSCWDAGFTPLYLYVSLVGVKPGALWRPADPNPPNGIIRLTQTANPCAWVLVAPPFIWEFRTVAPMHGFYSSFVGEFEAWYQAPPPPLCRFAGFNEVNAPAGHHYYLGTHQIAWLPPTDSPSIETLADLLGIPITDSLRTDFWPAGSNANFKYTDKVENTNILIERDFS